MDYFSASCIIAFIHTLTCLVMKISSPRWSLKNLHLQDAACSFTSLMMSSGWSAWHLAGTVLVLNRCSWFPFLRMRALCLDASLSFCRSSWILHLSNFGSKPITLFRVFCCYYSLPILLSLVPVHPFLLPILIFALVLSHAVEMMVRRYQGPEFGHMGYCLTLPVHPEFLTFVRLGVKINHK